MEIDESILLKNKLRRGISKMQHIAYDACKRNGMLNPQYKRRFDNVDFVMNVVFNKKEVSDMYCAFLVLRMYIDELVLGKINPRWVVDCLLDLSILTRILRSKLQGAILEQQLNQCQAQ